MLPSASNQLFATGVSDIHSHNTRNSAKLFPKPINTNIGKFSIVYQGTSFWNTLPANLCYTQYFNIFYNLLKSN